MAVSVLRLHLQNSRIAHPRVERKAAADGTHRNDVERSKTHLWMSMWRYKHVTLPSYVCIPAAGKKNPQRGHLQ